MFNQIFKNKRVLVTGDTGFKGSWLALWLKELGANVYGISNPPILKYCNYNLCSLKDIINHTNLDIRDDTLLIEKLKKIKPHIVFHLAAQPLVLESYKNPKDTFATNVMGVVNVFEAIRQIDSIKVFINVTSDKCYKNNEWYWGYRENDMLGGKDPYSASKSASEIISESYIQSFFNSQNSANIGTVRAGNVIGAGDWAKNRIIPDFFRSIKTNKVLNIRSPHSTRPWQHVLEPLSGYLDLASRLYIDGNKYQGSWNFGPKNEINHSVIDLVNELKKYTKRIDINFETELTNNFESKYLKLDISKAISQMGWLPVFDFFETIKFTVEGYLNDLSNDSALENRLETINQYSKKAAKLELPWTK